MTRDSSQKISQFSILVAAHQAEVRGPPVGRGSQVENRCSILNMRTICIKSGEEEKLLKNRKRKWRITMQTSTV